MREGKVVELGYGRMVRLEGGEGGREGGRERGIATMEKCFCEERGRNGGRGKNF